MLRRTRQRAALTALAAVFVMAACDSEDLSRQLTGPGGAAEAAFAVPLGAATGLPAGSFTVADTVDLWARGVSLAASLGNQDVQLAMLKSGQDPLRPALVPVTGTARVAIVNGAAFGQPTLWTSWNQIRGLKPSTGYVLYVMRAATVVRGELDHLAVLRGNTITQPDSLFALGGTAPAWNATDRCFLATGAQRNPCAAHAFNTDLAGDANPAFFSFGFNPVPPNTFSPFNLPQRNWVVLYEAAVVSNTNFVANPAAPVFRQQIGPALDPAGQPIPNALAPFPTQAAPPAVLASLTFQNATPLASGQTYVVWAVNSETGEAVRLVGNWERMTPGLVVEASANNVSEFPGGGKIGDINVFRATTATTDVIVAQYDELLVTIESAGATAPGDVVFLRAEVDDLPAAGSVEFAGGYAFGGSGTAFFFGDELRVNVTNLPAPPTGFFYEVWLVNSANPSASVSLGPLLTPFPEYASLRDADTTMELGQLITAATVVVDQDELGVTWGQFTHVYVTLSSKVREGLPLNVALRGEIPTQVREANPVPE